MKRIIQLALLMACVLGMEMGQPAHAAQFNITIPMNLSRIPAEYNSVVVKGYILCSSLTGVTGGEQSGMGPNPFNHQVGNTIYGLKIVGASQTIHPINTATGEFHSSISLALNAAQGFYPNNVVAAAYVFKLQGSDSNVQDLVPISFENAGGNNPRYVSFHNPAQVGSKCDNENPEY